ncbi:hypothetical protein DLAC_07778 [Tieghemostelium lacteum]|uniref:MRH domain-containing protein n=1 Tax=Tieghemostelium lacteum TaxID=361077 RepID=A0A151ZAD4_TIELA|nr:hypothetical protein DLAC_07778 [Tieghemostelium lacteum]|eukprot:KYQ90905.1 hypothetical protein DLAC_07778 [Tieghemostelium lacteum]
MKYKLYFTILFVFCINFIKCQSSAGNCKFNGIDYGLMSLSNVSVTKEYSYTTLGGVIYIWNICNSAPSCTSKLNDPLVSSCQRDNGKWRNTGKLDAASFQVFYGANGPFTKLIYAGGDNSGCLNRKQRLFDRSSYVAFKCVPGKTTTISQAYEESLCVYRFDMEGDGACLPSTSSNSQSSSSEDNSIDCTYDKITNTMQVVNYREGLNIECIGKGITHCFNDRISCGTEDPTSPTLKCSTKHNSLTCISKEITCTIGNYTCTM